MTIVDDEEDDVPKYSIKYASWSLFLVSMSMIIITLARTAFSTFIFYAVLGKKDDEFYNMNLLFKMNSHNNGYGIYMQIFSYTLIPSLLLFAPFANGWNLKITLGVCTIISSLAMVLHAVSYEIWHLHVLICIIGLVQGVCSAIPYMMPSLYF